MARTTGQCPLCPREVEIKFSTERLIEHDDPDGERCGGSDRRPKVAEAPAEPRPQQKKRSRNANPVGRIIEKHTPAAPAKRPPKGGSVWTVSGGLPGLGKHR